MILVERGKYIWLLLLGLILGSNIVLYNTNLGNIILPTDTALVVFGSLFDLIIFVPVFFMLYRKKFSIKLAIALVAAGCILARVVIPSSMLLPFEPVIWTGIAIEAVIIFYEIVLIIAFVRYMPKVINDVKGSSLPVIFSFQQAVDRYVKNNPIIHVICSEGLIYYYAFFSWKEKPASGVTLYKNTSYIAVQGMLLHALVIETLAVHWWLHNVSVILSVILLIMNIYTFILIIGNIQALRLNPIYADNRAMYISMGLFKRMKIEFDNIENIVEDSAILERKLAKDTIDFLVSDFEKVYPDFILHMNNPVKVTYLMGIKKAYSKIAIRSDSPAELKQILLEGIKRNS
ncbi:beta-carotene 15,15'-monooxygenase [Oceanobacillus chungangensis]|uniref:Beta-carotene 15,15'-monooxygenase n=1 Tax=Oceanobacillus chungangensis TaxID=1229152 RepID=A0A3D8PZ85_9BACI|nr:beta-carotene 15,15'-monooxygenase [Oceanobacillus chungangensis]RDW20479.1 beta-carotene 15,15'-monooxygenase [Oceanobacillus chungangensis]